MREIISAAEAARILHCRPQKVRERIKAGRWTFGKAVPPAKPGGQITYDIYARRMYQFFGMELPDNKNAPKGAATPVGHIDN